MKYSEISKKSKTVDIADYYAVKVRSIWYGLKQESAAFWFLCMYIALEYIRPQTLYSYLDFVPWTQIALLLAVISVYYDQTIKWVKSPVNPLLIIFFIIVLFSSIFAFRPSVSWEYIDIIFNWLILIFLIPAIINSEKRFFIFILLFLLVNFKMSQHGFFSFASRGFSYARWGVSGSPGWFRDSGDFGVQMTVFVPLSVAFVLALKEYWGRYKKMFFYFIVITGVVTIIATSSRGALLGFAGTCVWFLLKSKKGIKMVAVVSLLGGILFMTLPNEMMNEFDTAGDDKTSRDRLEHWDFGMDVVKENPVLGVGYKNWLEYCYFRNPEGLGSKAGCRLPHNTYIDAASETGLLGFFTYLILIIFIFIMNSRSRKYAERCDNKFLIYTSYGIDGGLVGYLISTFFFSVLFYPIFWVQVAMSMTLLNVSSQICSQNKTSV